MLQPRTPRGVTPPHVSGGQHRGDEILAMGVAGEADAKHMQDHERQGDVGERAVHFADD